ncbi:MAG: alpha/beta fold hydrolase [Rhodospirillaceae bacterium]|nr:alpha/beta fold hydrolase [Rhodospirillaceae bacterium]
MGVKVWREYGSGRYGQIHIACAQPASGPGSKTPVICFHQSPSSGAQYKVFQRVMAEDRLVLCPDTPGFGGSDGPEAPVTIPDYADAMADMLDGLGYGTKGKGAVDVVGCHTGTLIGTELAASRPDLVRRLALPSLALFTADERAKMKAQFGGPQPILSEANFVPKVWQTTVIDGTPEITLERRLEMFAERLRAGTKSWFGPEASLNYDCESRIKLVTQPILLLVLNEMLGPNTRRGKDIVQRPTVVDISDRAHHSAWDAAPDLMAQHIRAFFDAV